MPRGPQYSDDELLDEIRRLAQKLNRVPLKRDMNKHGKHASRTYQLRFGSWADAIREAGFQPREKGTDYEERPDACPLCSIEQTGLDFHHWRYGEDEIGCYLCRECHDAVHQGKADTENVNWLPNAVKNLVSIHVERHGDNFAEEIMERYNMPNFKPLVEMALSGQI